MKSLVDVERKMFLNDHRCLGWMVVLLGGFFWGGLGLEQGAIAASFFSDEKISKTPQSSDLEVHSPLVFSANNHLLPTFFLSQNDNQERFIQPDANPPQPLEEEPDVIEPTEQPTQPPATTPQPMAGDIQVNSLSLSGSTVFTDETFAESFKPFIGQRVTEEFLQQLADVVTERYLEEGYITSRAILDPDSLASGNIQLKVVEGGIETIEVEGIQRLNPNYIRSRVALGVDTPLNTGDLENQLRLLRADPLLDNVEASLRTGTQPGQSILVVRVTESRNFRGAGFTDNYSPPSVGSERVGARLNYYNLSGLGDIIGTEYTHTVQGGSDTFDFNYRLPVNPMNGTVQFRTSLNSNDVVLSTDIFDIRGNTQLYELNFRQPLIRSPREEFALSAGFTYQRGQTFTIFGPTPIGLGSELDGETKTSVFKFGQDYTIRDSLGAWAFRSQFSFGLGLFNTTINVDPIPDTRFFSWLGQVQRVQILNENNFLIAALDVQFSSEPLLASQQFVIGGGQSVRGYRQNLRTGDNGLRFSLEDRMTLVRNEAGDPILIFAPFFDMGYVWNTANNPITLSREKFIAGIGAGLIWEPISGFNVRLDYGYPLVTLSDRGNNAQDDGLYFNVVWEF